MVVRTGRTAWGEDWTASRMFTKGYASFIVMKNRILVLAEDGTLFLMSADKKALDITDMVKVCGNNWCNPAYADGRLFLRDEKELLCLGLLE